ncbi:MAG: oligopeptide transporter, OPT family [Verrucomicrobiota bacterium]|nr:oligopeptide transporter, OPT family [Verrucomicrobiota bacterium]
MGQSETHATNSPATHQPYIAPETRIAEFTPRAVITGTLLGMIFGASSLYLVLKVGITVSASIPVAVISITLFRLLSKFGVKDATILENNIVQTSGSAGESLAFGIGVTMPAILVLGFDLEATRVLLVAILGGLLGILMMIPLRRALIVQQHGILKYPEGTACAEVLKAGASAESRAAAAPFWKKQMEEGTGSVTQATTIFTGFGIGLIYKFIMDALHGWKAIPEKIFGTPFKGGSVGTEVSPELLGIGYIIGPRIASIMVGGGVLAYLVLIPMISFFGENVTVPVAPSPGTKLIRDMSPNEIRGAYILYIGAGAVAAAGIISLVRSLPLIGRGLREGLKNVGNAGAAIGAQLRTASDLSLKLVFGGIIIIIIAIMAAPTLHMNLLGALLIVLFGFLFVTVSSRLTGEIGSSSNPISGMTVATLLLTCLIFLALGWTGGIYYVTALSVGAIVCIASSNGGTTSQDLKTGFLVGATPKYQQIALFCGVVASALILGPILLRLNDAATVYVPAAQVAPGLKTTVDGLKKRESLKGPQAAQDNKSYYVWHKTEKENGPTGKYLVDDAGNAVYLVDPGINGSFSKRPDGTEVKKYDAPKAILMSYIIKGILDRELPWGLVLVGVMIAVVLELASVPSLAFAVGVYLPLATSAPVFIGGMIRYLVDRKRRAALEAANQKVDETFLAAEADRSPGVLAASGYIAGGAIAGIFIAIFAGFFENNALLKTATAWSANNPFYTGEYANLLALIPFALLCGFLYLVGREKLLKSRKS